MILLNPEFEAECIRRVRGGKRHPEQRQKDAGQAESAVLIQAEGSPGFRRIHWKKNRLAPELAIY
jgi:hypothetical protein